MKVKRYFSEYEIKPLEVIEEEKEYEDSKIFITTVTAKVKNLFYALDKVKVIFTKEEISKNRDEITEELIKEYFHKRRCKRCA